MPFTNFCCRSGGSNLNAGTRTGNTTEPGTSATFTYASGSWVASTGVFTVASGNPTSDGVAVDDFCSVYADGSSVTGFVGRVTARSSTTITVSLGARLGAAPADGTSNRTLKIGGAWRGPNAADGFPLSIANTSSVVNSSNDRVRFSLKNDQTYSITANVTDNTGSNGLLIQGYTSTYGDGGKATLDGGSPVGSSFILLTLQSNHIRLQDFIAANNGDTGSSVGISITASGCSLVNVVVHHARGAGISASSSQGLFISCEAYSCNPSGGSAAGIVVSNGVGINCISHDNILAGFHWGSGNLVRCIADTNNSDGFRGGTSNTSTNLIGCDAYNNGDDGLEMLDGSVTAISCNFIKNGGIGIRNAASRPGYAMSCGFGSGTAANGGGATTGSGSSAPVIESGTVTYASNVTPWVDPANGDFRINLAAAQGTGYGAFTQTAGSYAGTVAYLDVGAAQHQATAGGGPSRPIVAGTWDYADKG